MYINEVLRACDALCPNEYSDEEKYMWCDELSASLTQEYLKKYDKVTIEAGKDGSYLLPEGVTFEMVDRIIDGAHEIIKRDFRSYGIEYYYGQTGRFVLPVRNRVRGIIDVIYLRQHDPIRSGWHTVTVKFQSNGFFVKYADAEICEGDIIDIITKDDTLSDEQEFEPGESFENVAVLSVEAVDAQDVFVFVGNNIFKDLPHNTNTECKIKRVVTDETVCGAPYDRMYIDYVNAQICYYQRDFDTYNQHMNLFNQRLDAYQAWLQQRMVQDKDGKITNWW